MDNDSDKTWGDLVREYFPDAGGDEADYILWNLTAFPFADVETIRGQLAHIKAVGIQAAHDEIEAQMAQLSGGR